MDKFYFSLDVDECERGIDDCHASATCTNTYGNYSCSCNIGFSGDGFYCADVDECPDMPCHDDAACNNTYGSFECECLDGYIGDGFNCSGKG